MEFVVNSTSQWTPAQQLFEEDLWDAGVFLRSNLQFRRTRRSSRPLADLAQRLFEGTRQSSASEAPDRYRSSAISPFDLSPLAAQWALVSSTSPEAVVAGDVLIKRIAPVQAAVSTQGLPRLPVDANIFVVRGLPEVQAWWTAYCLNHSSYGDYLVSKSGKTALRRLTRAVLSSWVLTDAPAAFSPVALELSALARRRNLIKGQFAALQNEVDAAATRQVSATEIPAADSALARASWSFSFPATIIDSSWLPLHAASRYRSELLHRDADWQPLSELLTPEQPSWGRFSQISEPIPVLRLSDIADIPAMPTGLPLTFPAQPSRVFRAAVEADEVLLSTLGNNPRVVFALAPPGRSIYPSDHWKRLRFRCYPAAYTLLLQTSAVVRQFQGMTYGSTQDFIRPQDILRLFVPKLSAENLSRWDNALRSLAKSWNQTDAEWRTVLAHGWRVFCRDHGLTAP